MSTVHAASAIPASAQQSHVRARPRRFVRALLFVLFSSVLFSLSLPLGVVRVYSADIGLAVLLSGTFILKQTAPPTARSNAGLTTLDFLFLALLGVIIVTNFHSYHWLNSLNGSLDWVRAGCLYFAARALIRRGFMRFEDLGWVACWAWSVEAFVAGVQYFSGEPFGLVANYFGQNRNEILTYAWTPYDVLVWRISGTHNHSIMFGLWLATFAVLAYGYLRRSGGLAARVFRATILALTFVLLFVSVTRGTLIFFIAAIAVCSGIWALANRSRTILYLSALSAVLAVVFLYFVLVPGLMSAMVDSSPLVARFSQIEDDLRVRFIAQGFALFSNNAFSWFAGVGTNAMFPAALAEGVYRGDIWFWKDLTNETVGIENIYLKLLFENGIFTVLIFISMHLKLLSIAFRRAMEDVHVMSNAALLGICIGWIVAFNIYLLVISPFYSLVMASVMATIGHDKSTLWRS